jgi:hypothetical protein
LALLLQGAMVFAIVEGLDLKAWTNPSTDRPAQSADATPVASTATVAVRFNLKNAL